MTTYLKSTATVKELKEILKDLPDDMMVVTSEFDGRGGLMQAFWKTFHLPYLGTYYKLDDESMNRALKDVEKAMDYAKEKLQRSIEQTTKNEHMTEQHRKACLANYPKYYENEMNELNKIKKQIEYNLSVDESERKNNAIELSCNY